MLKILSKLWKRRQKKPRTMYYQEFMMNQRERLHRIARLLECSPDEAEELLELIAEWLWSARALNSKMVKSDRTIGANVPPEVERFVIENGLDM